MASYNELNALIDAYINRNGVQAITGQILNGVLKAMVEQLGRGYTIMGAAIPTTDPGTPDGPECYFASAPGTYTDFDGLQIVPGELALLCYTPTDGWTKATIYEGFQEVQATIDGNVGTPSVGVSYADGVLSFDFRNMKGNTGDAAGFGTIGADITGGVGTPGVSVESSGPATAKNLQFHFTNLKGETGVTSVVATVDNTTGTPACTVSLVGQQLTLAFTGLKGAQGDTGVSADYPIAIVNNLTTDDAASALSAAQGVVLQGEITQLEAEVDEKFDEFDLYKDALYVTDSGGNVIAKIDGNGVESVDFKAGNKKLSEMPDNSMAESILPDYYKKEFYLSDAEGNVICKVGKDGLETVSIKAADVQKNDWLGKNLSVFGDSVVAINNGDFSFPYSFATTAASWMWANRVAQYFRMGKQYGRGIGGSGYKWTTQGSNGGCVAFVSDTGRPLGRLQEYTLDEWNALETKVYPPGVTAEMISGGTAFAIRSSMCSWSRITKMYPESIKDTISVILLLAHNDAAESTDPSFIDNDTTDPEWASSDYYSTYDGDYNITTFKGAIASLIMKLQVWMPNAIIVLLTPIQGYGPTPGEPNTNLALTGLRGQYAYVETVHTMLGIPLIDVFGTCGINGLNRASYIADTIHPYTEAGGKMIARAIVGGLKTILPFDSMNF